MTINVCPVATEDKADWQALWTLYLEFYETERGQDIKDLSWARILDAKEPMFSQIARNADGKAVGLVNYLYHRNFWQAEDVCYLNDLFVLPETRGTGAGRKLIDAVYQQVKADGLPEVYWLTAKDNTTAKRLYDSVVEQFPFDVYLMEA
ncbi:Acetyltransferase (GNAT) family protein [Shimia gijangensis]|uniref:Acetyltransferase (GNAT) family protein n=1 Tax=Shimia gijangensis TaxID=1470563 RepID=A0A1M6R8H4_9RHOB|nr:GNAT family N-acetyltransferase [Shimia gijangensis]SHK28597.1 Acetyltransferase (GNAT) family protein [Shimia gijangensis]